MDNSIERIPSDWLDTLARIKAQIEAGETVPMEPVLERLRTSIARMEARQATPTKRSATKA